jgi:hypothetical protein
MQKAHTCVCEQETERLLAHFEHACHLNHYDGRLPAEPMLFQKPMRKSCKDSSDGATWIQKIDFPLKFSRVLAVGSARIGYAADVPVIRVEYGQLLTQAILTPGSMHGLTRKLSPPVLLLLMQPHDHDPTSPAVQLLLCTWAAWHGHAQRHLPV